ncbi:O-methyltransferase [Duganella sp. HH105]|uniref:O-methyltransferase n=1 Tax=Duganella sp. HH105 TaxID=1781067 RepID=UPI000877D814|nr:class I SAM-dependent methyltransferase [Duganella sp. HH105]OEZ59099.1 O-methyltransferase [Duganella sp. HH105]
MNFSTDEILRPLHEQSQQQSIARARMQFAGGDEDFTRLLGEYMSLAPSQKGKFLKRYGLSTGDTQTSQGTPMSLAVSPEMGRFLYSLALMRRPARILELGSSYGVSTLYFASALRQIGKGEIIATELDALKCKALLENLRAAGVQSWVDLREGDVFDAVGQLEGTFDMIFMDVWASLYLDLFRKIEPFLKPGSVVITDNMYTAEEEVLAFKRYLSGNPAYSSITLDFESGVELTVMI